MTERAINAVRLAELVRVSEDDGNWKMGTKRGWMSIAHAVNWALTETRDRVEILQLDIGADIFIAGRSPAVDRLLDELFKDQLLALAFAPESDEDLLRLGYMGWYRGARLVKLVEYRRIGNDPSTEIIGPDELIFFAGTIEQPTLARRLGVPEQ
jgi:hypothetical protein